MLLAGLAALAPLTAAAQSAGEGAVMVDLRTGRHDGFLRLVFDLEAATAPEPETQREGTLVRLLLPRLRRGEARQGFTGDLPPVGPIRVGVTPGAPGRIEIQVTRPVEAKVYVLPTDSATRHRLVADLYPDRALAAKPAAGTGGQETGPRRSRRSATAASAPQMQAESAAVIGGAYHRAFGLAERIRAEALTAEEAGRAHLFYLYAMLDPASDPQAVQHGHAGLARAIAPDSREAVLREGLVFLLRRLPAEAEPATARGTMEVLRSYIRALEGGDASACDGARLAAAGQASGASLCPRLMACAAAAADAAGIATRVRPQPGCAG